MKEIREIYNLYFRFLADRPEFKTANDVVDTIQPILLCNGFSKLYFFCESKNEEGKEAHLLHALMEILIGNFQKAINNKIPYYEIEDSLQKELVSHAHEAAFYLAAACSSPPEQINYCVCLAKHFSISPEILLQLYKTYEMINRGIPVIPPSHIINNCLLYGLYETYKNPTMTETERKNLVLETFEQNLYTSPLQQKIQQMREFNAEITSPNRGRIFRR